ncbi:hypothetical protein LTR82_002997 [Friedmanniomyces endolithicus]|uniref:Uncharacterized protein n=1 Tax=Friedmanniomyces endolithicus TaxID=329885 RepID=A0AAN6FXH0_9PEZI|nr:hypothetical protein LTR82_002997 [Friedmanniomyces endolithicus]
MGARPALGPGTREGSGADHGSSGPSPTVRGPGFASAVAVGETETRILSSMARPSRRADSATTRAGTVSSLSSSLAASAASREYRSALSEDNVRQAMEALTLGEKRDSERRVRFQATGSEDRLRGPVGGGQSGCGQAMVEARERVRAGKEEAEEWEVVEEEEQEEEQEEEEHEQESSDEESTDDESSDDEEWVLESDGMVVAQVVEFV